MDRVIDVKLGVDTPTDRVRAWKNILDQNYMGVKCKNVGDDLRAALKIRSLDNGSVARSRFTRQTLYRTPELIKAATEETVLIAFVRGGTNAVRQGDESAILDGRGVYILDSSRPFEVHFASDHVAHSAIHVPKAALVKRIGPIDDLAFGPAAPLQKLLAAYAHGLTDALEELNAETLDALLNHTLDLLALMVAQRQRTAIDPSTHRAGMLLRIKAYIKAHLRDQDLTIERTAHAVGISARYLNALLATEGTSFGRYLLATRLEQARREIIDPRRVHKQVTEVAFDWEFKNASHFGRAFKDKYGMAPRDAKRREDV